MWDRNHLANLGETYWTHFKFAIKISTLLILAAVTLGLHAVIPWWQQPRKLQLAEICNYLDLKLVLRGNDDSD